jgi:serine protease
VSGAAANVKIHVQKVCGPQGCPTSAIVNAIYAAADVPGMVAMNVSIGGGRLSTGEKNAIAYATNKGVLVIASAGNAGTSQVECPACDVNAISVSATNWRDGLAVYSSYGRGLDISAPGGELYSNTTDEMGIYSAFLNGGYAYLQGTSMATPQVTGTAAIVASKTGLRGAALRARLEGTVNDIGTAGYDTKFGAGRVNAYRAVTNTALGAGL